MKYKTILAILLFTASTAVSQNSKIDEWVKFLKIDGNKQVLAAASVEDSIGVKDTIQIKGIIQDIENATSKSNLRLQARVQSLKARLLFYKLEAGDSLYATVMKEALEKAYRLDDSYMIAEFSRWYGEMLNTLGEKSKSAQYCINGLKMQEELGFEYFPNIQTFFFSTGNILHNGCNPNSSINYFKKGLEFGVLDNTNKRDYAGALNSTGFIYYLTGNFDSSLKYLLHCKAFSRSNNLFDLNYLSFANSFETYLALKQYDSCKIIVDKIYKAGLQGNEDLLVDAVKFYGMLAQRKEQYSEAIKWLLQYISIAKKMNVVGHKLLYRNLAECYEKIGQTDIAYPYYKVYKEIMDSVARVNKSANELFLMADAAYQKERRDFKENNKKRQRQSVFIATGVGLLVLFFGFLIFRLRKKKRNVEVEKVKAQQKSLYFETKYNTAEEQLRHLKEVVVNKEKAIETLQLAQEQIKGDNKNIDEIEKLSRQVILTENDWEVFKETFNTVYPGFFITLKSRFPDITNAELRMAALIRLNFDMRHVASMLGISLESVHKARYRLRKRFNGSNTEDTLEDFITSI